LQTCCAAYVEQFAVLRLQPLLTALTRVGRSCAAVAELTDMSWFTLIPSTLFACTIAAWWFTKPKTRPINLLALVGSLLFLWAVAPVVLSRLVIFLLALAMTIASLFRVDALVLNHADKLLTAGAVLW
jgi:hypothetical protein